jgi:hypothetical protein
MDDWKGTPCFATDQSQFTKYMVDTCLPQWNGPAVYLVGDSKTSATLYALLDATSLPVFHLGAFFGIYSYHPENWLLVMERLKTVLKANDIVIVHERLEADPVRTSAQYWEDKENLAKIVEYFGAKLVVFGDFAILPDDPRKCALSGDEGPCTVAKSASLYWQAEKRQAIAKLMQSHKSVYFFDPMEYLCIKDSCGPYVPGTRTMAYFDSTHLGEWGARYLWPFICPLLQSLTGKS